jgi:transcriptional regulator with XRE-family HTH domain
MGERLRRLREAAGMSQTDLARAAGIPIGSLRNWEQDRRIPRLDAAASLAAAMHVSLDTLAGDLLGQGGSD